MKKFKRITAIAAAACVMTACLGMQCVWGSEAVTSEDVRSLIYENTLSGSEHCEEMLEQDYYPDDDMANPVKAGSIIEPEKAVLSLGHAYSITSYYDNGAESFEEAMELCGQSGGLSERYLMPSGESESGVDLAYALSRTDFGDEEYVYFYMGSPFYLSDESIEKIASAVNKFSLGVPDKIYFFNLDPSVYVKTASGEYIIPLEERMNVFTEYLGEAESCLEAFVPVSISEFNDYTKGFELSQTEARQKLLEKLREAAPEYKTIDELRRYDSTENTDSFSKYLGTAPQYSDISQNMAAVTNQLTELGVITGNGGKFFPNDNVTRGEFSAMVCRLFELSSDGGGSFSDIPEGYWAEQYIRTLADKGVLSGFDDGTFRPDDGITYEQAFKILEYMMGYVISDGYPTQTNLTAVRLGWTDDLSSFDSGSPMTRIELACVLSRVIDTHMTTRDVYISEFGLHTYMYTDITLAEYLEGKPLRGALITNAEKMDEYDEQAEQRYAELCGGVIDEFNRMTGVNMSRGISGGISYTVSPGSSTARI